MRVRTHTRIILFTLPILIAINSCIREENDLSSRNCTTTCTTITGTVTSDDGTPLAGVRITANYEGLQRLIFIARRKGDVITNSAGEFRMDFEIRDDETTTGNFLLRVLVGDEYYSCSYEDDPEIFLHNLQRGNNNRQDIYIPYQSQITLKPVGTDKMTHGENLSVTIYPENNANMEMCGASKNWNGSHRVDVHQVEVPANNNLVLETTVYKQSVSTTTYDTVKIQRGETIEYKAVFN